MFKLPIKFLLLIVCYFAVTSEASVIYSSVSQDSLTVGDIIEFSVHLVVPKNAQVIAPAVENSFGKLVVKNYAEKKTEKNNSDSLYYSYLLTFYSVEPCTIGALTYIVIPQQAQPETLKTEPVALRMISVLTADSTDTIDIKDLKPQQVAGSASLMWLWCLFGVLIASLAAVIIIVRFLKNRKRRVKETPPKPPYEEAVEAIAALEAKQLLRQGLIREFVFELSEILKRYISRRFEVNAAEFTTQEIMEWIEVSPLETSLRTLLQWFFRTTDPVKFAKWIPDSNTVNRFLEQTKLFVEKTKPVSEQQPASAGGVSSDAVAKS